MGAVSVGRVWLVGSGRVTRERRGCVPSSEVTLTTLAEGGGGLVHTPKPVQSCVVHRQDPAE